MSLTVGEITETMRENREERENEQVCHIFDNWVSTDWSICRRELSHRPPCETSVDTSKLDRDTHCLCGNKICQLCIDLCHVRNQLGG